MHRKLTLAFFLFGSVCLPLSSSIGQDSTGGKVFKDILRETSKELSDDEIKEIAAIRDQLGGGTGLELDKLFSELKDPAPAKAAKHVEQSVPKQSGVGRGIPRSGAVEVSLSKSTVASQLFLQAVSGKVPGNGKLNSNGKVNSANSAQSNVTLMRSLASRIDGLASELERLALYEDADFLRQRARAVRQRARETERKTRTAELRRAVGR